MNNDKSGRRIPRYTDRAINRDIKERARIMRKHPTAAEAILWQRLRHKRVGGYRFRRQHPIGRYFVDFNCAEAKLVLEVDGAIHAQPGQGEHDKGRQYFLEGMGLRVLRFTNAHVIRETDQVIETIADNLDQ